MARTPGFNSAARHAWLKKVRLIRPTPSVMITSSRVPLRFWKRRSVT
jgi:hypothetical protein